jgi:hypothetical protein
METLKIRLAAVVHPNGNWKIVESFGGYESEAMNEAIHDFDNEERRDVQRYWVDFELPIPESPIPVHRATVTPFEPDKGTDS